MLSVESMDAGRRLDGVVGRKSGAAFPSETLLRSMGARALTLYEAGEEIAAPSGALYQVAYGVVRVASILNDGRRAICAFHLPGEIFGLAAEGMTSSFRTEAVDAIGLKTLILPGDPRFAGSVLQMALLRLAQAQEHLLVVGRQTATERLAAFLLDIAHRQQTDKLDLAMPRTDIADYLGLTPETVCRGFKQLRDQGIIDFTLSRHVTLVREAALRRLVA